jgi:hypothetical protein
MIYEKLYLITDVAVAPFEVEMACMKTVMAVVLVLFALTSSKLRLLGCGQSYLVGNAQPVGDRLMTFLWLVATIHREV